MTGNDEDMADILEEDLQDYGFDVETSDVGFTDANDYLDSDLCIFITYTYGEGVMTDELADFYGELKDLDLTGKHFAVMGSGDKTYGEHFCENVFDGLCCVCGCVVFRNDLLWTFGYKKIYCGFRF